MNMTGTRLFLRLILMLFCVVAPGSVGAQTVYPIAADAVYGQTSFTTLGTPPLDMRIYRASGLAADSEGVYISDSTNNRVLFFAHGDQAATRVYGQPSFTQTGPNTGGISAQALSGPSRIAVGASGLYVTDFNNHRVLHFPTGSTVADRVYGQPDFASNKANNGGLSASSLNFPNGVALDSQGGLYVCDGGNNRLLYFPPGETTASFVYGQPSFTSSGASSALDRLKQPAGVAVDSEGLYTTEWFSNRVKFFPHGQKTSTRVYGQPDMYSMVPNAFGMGPRSLMRPVDCAADENGLYVAEYLNSRVLFFPKGSTVASVVYGQPDFHTLGLNQYGISRYGFYVTNRVGVSADKVYVADYQPRVLRFPKVLIPMAADTEFSSLPAVASAGHAFASPVVVTVRRTDGTPATDFHGSVSLRIRQGEGDGCAVLNGPVAVNAQAGVATFTGLSISAPGIYRLEAFALSLPVGESGPVAVGPGQDDAVRADLDGDGAFTMADIVKHLRVTGGLEAKP